MSELVKLIILKPGVLITIEPSRFIVMMVVVMVVIVIVVVIIVVIVGFGLFLFVLFIAKIIVRKVSKVIDFKLDFVLASFTIVNFSWRPFTR